MEDRGGKGLLFLQSVVTLAHSPRPCFIFPVSVHVDDVCTTGSCWNVLVKRWRKGKRTTEGYNWHWKIFIHELLCIKKRTNERRERVSFFMHGNKWIKIFQCQLYPSVVRFPFLHRFTSTFQQLPVVHTSSTCTDTGKIKQGRGEWARVTTENEWVFLCMATSE